MSITTSYFAISKNLKGTRISVARFNNPRMVQGSIDGIQTSFAPSKNLILSYKDEKIQWGEYKRRYIAEQRKHYRENLGDFEKLLDRATREDITLLCYERFEGPKTKCHRLLLYDILQKIAKAKKYKVNFIDEKLYIKK